MRKKYFHIGKSRIALIVVQGKNEFTKITKLLIVWSVIKN